MGKKIRAFKSPAKKMPVYLKTGFTPSDTHFIKGIAILWVMWHHLCDVPERYCYGTTFPAWINIYGKSLTMWFSNVGDISVTIFSFIGGYALYKCFGKPHFFTNKLWSLYKNYWKIFFVFVPIGFLFFSHQEQFSPVGYYYGVFSQFNLMDFIRTLFGLHVAYNFEWWFFFFYVKAIFIALIFIHINKKRKSYYIEIGQLLLFMYVLIAIKTLSNNEGFDFLRGNTILDDFFSRIEVLSCVIMGCIFGKYDILTRLINWLHSLPVFSRKLISVATVIVIISCRSFYTWDYIFVPALIPALYELFGYIPIVQRCMGFVGKNSGNIYYMHTFLIYYFGVTAKIIYKPNNSFVSFIIFVALCLLISVLINKFYDLLYKAGRRLHLFDTIKFEDTPKSEPLRNETMQYEALQQKTFQVDSYKLPFICPDCGRTLEFGKRSVKCENCGIWYVKEKYREDEELKSLVGNNRIIYVKKS